MVGSISGQICRINGKKRQGVETGVRGGNFWRVLQRLRSTEKEVKAKEKRYYGTFCSELAEFTLAMFSSENKPEDREISEDNRVCLAAQPL